MNILKITIDNPDLFNVYFMEDDTPPEYIFGLVCQCSRNEMVQRFDFLEIESIIASGTIPVELSEYCKKTHKDRCEDWLASRRHKGFMFGDIPCPADAEAQANFTSVMNMIQIGATGPFLLHDNNNVDHWLTIAEVQSLCGQMATFVQGAYQACWIAKASIDSATIVEECDEAMVTLNEF